MATVTTEVMNGDGDGFGDGDGDEDGPEQHGHE